MTLMTSSFTFFLALSAALGSGLMMGLFFAFSSFVMKALARLSAGSGIAAMQAINASVLNILFMGVFLGTAAVCVALVITAYRGWGEPGASLLMASSLLYLFGILFVTVFFNVPLNNSLAAAEPASEAGAELWPRYLGQWTAWNHLRTVAGLFATAGFTLALRAL